MPVRNGKRKKETHPECVQTDMKIRREFYGDGRERYEENREKPESKEMRRTDEDEENNWERKTRKEGTQKVLIISYCARSSLVLRIMEKEGIERELGRKRKRKPAQLDQK